MPIEDLVFGDDQPKENPWQHDRLGFAPFAKRIFNVVVRMQAPNGYVIGLHGRWGSGKSTVINFIDAYLQKHNEEAEDEASKVTRIDFRPWNVSGHQDLIVAFFKVLSEELGPKESWWQRKYKGFFRWIGGTTDGLVDAAATVALTVDPSGGVASGFAGNLAKKSVNSMLGRFLEDPSLQTAYQNLRLQLGSSGRKFLITIDDIDRLQPTEVRDIMQMVKTVGRLPNVIYLLAYDREIVWNALDGEAKQNGPRYAEKIVQQELELPLPSRNALFAILDHEIKFLTGGTEDGSRWQWIVREGVRRWVKHPRDVMRLSTALKFTWPALEGEFDAQDLLAIEGIRLFDPILFEWIRLNRDFLFNEGRFFMGQDEERKALIEALQKRLPEIDVDSAMKLLSLLFPSQGKWFEQHHVGSEDHVDAHDRRGMANAASFDSYFQLHLSQDAMPNAALNELFKMETVADAYQLLLPYTDGQTSRGAHMAGEVLNDIRFRLASKKAPEPTTALLGALFKLGEEINAIPWSGGMGRLEGPGQLQYLVKDMLKFWGAEAGGANLIRAFEDNLAPIDAVFYFQRGRELDIFPNIGKSTAVISKETFDALGAILVEKFRTAAADGTLTNGHEIFSIVRSWTYLADASEPKKWVEDNLPANPAFAARVAKDLMTASSSGEGIEYRLRELPDPAIYDLDVLRHATDHHLSGQAINAADRNLLERLKMGLDRMAEGNMPRSLEQDLGEED